MTSANNIKTIPAHAHRHSADMIHRPRRLRTSDAMRRLVRETHLHTDDFIYPIFVDESLSEPVEVSSMPGVFRQSEKSMADVLKQVEAAKIPAVEYRVCQQLVQVPEMDLVFLQS